MDLNDVRTLWTVLSFAAFLAIVFWAYSGKRKARFEEAARLVLDDDADHPAAAPNKNHR
jgi:cytochrome c oxidase cbb3-type subunit 4